MCIISLIPANVELPQERLENGADSNRDGHGYAIASAAHGLEVFKSMRFAEAMDHLIEARAKHGPNSVVLFHSRIGTHGEYGEFNLHPFYVTEDTVMAHNGILPSTYFPAKGDRRSDTRVFVDQVAKQVCDSTSGLPSRRAATKLGSHIGAGNKLVFLSVKTGKPAVRMVNRHLGVDDGGVWYSNSGYRSSFGGWWGGGGHGVRTVVGARKVWEDCLLCGDVYAIDPATNTCESCGYCHDCGAYTEGYAMRGEDTCSCYVPPSRWVEKREEELDCLEIEDSGDDGWIKVDGVWVMARSLFSDEPRLPVMAGMKDQDWPWG